MHQDDASRDYVPNMKWWRRIRETDIHRIFELALFLKAAHSVIEIGGGVALLLTSTQAILAFADLLTRAELLEDPSDRVANYIFHTAEALSTADKSSAAFFLLSHGTVKLFLVGAVMLGKFWAYPTFMIALGGLIAYQTYQLAGGFSGPLLALTILDAVVLWLTWHEYRVVRQRRRQAEVNPIQGVGP